MKAYGYSKKQINAKGLSELREVTFSGSAKDLRQIAQFLMYAAEKKEQLRRSDHFHIREVFPEWLEKWPDIIAS